MTGYDLSRIDKKRVSAGEGGLRSVRQNIRVALPGSQLTVWVNIAGAKSRTDRARLNCDETMSSIPFPEVRTFAESRDVMMEAVT